jgi:hypothetical protein
MGAEDEEEEKKKKKTKRKGKEKEEEEDSDWRVVEGIERCLPCAKEGTQCRFNVPAVEKWRDEHRAGGQFQRYPVGTNCEACATVRKKPCPLPATKEMRDGIPKVAKGGRSRGGSAAPSATSSGKRKRRELEVVMPPLKRARPALPTTTTMGPEAALAMLARLLEASEGRAAESSRAAAMREEGTRAVMGRIALAMEQQNELLLQIAKRLEKEEGDEKQGEAVDGAVEEGSRCRYSMHRRWRCRRRAEGRMRRRMSRRWSRRLQSR